MEASTEIQAAESVEGPLVAQPDSTTLYMSRRRELMLVHTASWPLLGAGGIRIGETEPRYVQFSDGVFRTADEELIEWLQNHARYGDIDEGFWVVDQLAPAPSEAEINRIMEASVALDVETLQRLIDEEHAGWGRDAILTVAQGALNKIELMKTAAEEARAARELEQQRDLDEKIAKAVAAQEADIAERVEAARAEARAEALAEQAQVQPSQPPVEEE